MIKQAPAYAEQTQLWAAFVANNGNSSQGNQNYWGIP